MQLTTAIVQCSRNETMYIIVPAMSMFQQSLVKPKLKCPLNLQFENVPFCLIKVRRGRVAHEANTLLLKM